MDINSAINKLKDNIRERAYKLLNQEKSIFIEFRPEGKSYEFILAGNSLNEGTVNDLDIYGAGYNIKDKIGLDNLENKKIIFRSKNACSVKGKQYKIQFCSYFKPALSILVENFDFSKIQVGVRVEFTESETFDIKEVYVSEAYLEWKFFNSFTYIWSEYPLSSLFRLFKYFKREDCSKKERNICILKIIKDVLERGFADYDDYKDQLDAIDLMMLPDSQEAFELYQTLEKINLVKEKRFVELDD